MIFDRLLVVNCAVCIAMQFFGGVNYILILFEYNTDNTFFLLLTIGCSTHWKIITAMTKGQILTVNISLSK